jgi:octaprenyl-diphosphate synthase
MSQAAAHLDQSDTGPSGTEPERKLSLGFRINDLVSLVASEMQMVESRLAEQLESPVGRIPEVGRHLLGAGGKRLRPLLAVLVAQAGQIALDQAIAAGCAAELIHTATLFHDDVVDNGSVRRGRPAARMIYGNGIAVLVGDFCLARGLDLVASTGSIAMVRSLAATVTEMAEGEVAQLEGAGNADLTVAHYLRVVDRKTASLVTWCARVGGVLPPTLDQALGRFGRSLGRAFQIIDDVLDCAGDERTSGKSAGPDLQEGKLTLPVLLACDADPSLRLRIRAALGENGIPADKAHDLLTAVRAAGGIDRARKRAQAIASEAIGELKVLPSSPFREGLAELCRLSVDRVA